MPNETSASIVLQRELGITEILPDAGAWTNRFDIPSEDGSKNYRIAQMKKAKTWGCSCKGWIYHHGKPGFAGCKHLKALAPVLAMIDGTGDAQAKKLAEEKKHLEAKIERNKKSASFKYLYQNS